MSRKCRQFRDFGPRVVCVLVSAATMQFVTIIKCASDWHGRDSVQIKRACQTGVQYTSKSKISALTALTDRCLGATCACSEIATKCLNQGKGKASDIPQVLLSA